MTKKPIDVEARDTVAKIVGKIDLEERKKARKSQAPTPLKVSIAELIKAKK